MTRPIIAAAVAIGLSATPALAQDDSQPPAGSPPPSGPQVNLSGPDGERRGPPQGPNQGGAGLELTLGEDIELQVECGTTPIRECLEATTPYLDMLRQMRN